MWVVDLGMYINVYGRMEYGHRIINLNETMMTILWRYDQCIHIYMCGALCCDHVNYNIRKFLIILFIHQQTTVTQKVITRKSTVKVEVKEGITCLHL